MLGIDKLERRLKKNEEQLKRMEKFFHQLEDRVAKLENPHNPETVQKDKQKILRELKTPQTTTELAQKLNKHRTWISLLLNELQEKGMVYEKKRRGRQIVYAKV